MIAKLILIFLALLILPDVYIYTFFVARWQGNIWLKLLYFLPTLLLLAGIGWSFYTMAHWTGNQQMLQIQCFIWILFLFVFPKLLFFLIHLTGYPLIRWAHLPKSIVIGTGLVLATASVLTLIYGYSKGRSDFEVKEITYRSDQLPDKFRGFRIVQISDLHLGSSIGREKDIEKLVNEIDNLHPDLILFTGDLVNSRADETDSFRPILSRLHAPYGVYSVMGNHDYGSYFRWNTRREQAENVQTVQRYQQEMGWKLLNNSHAFLHKDTDSIALIGCENWGEPPFSQYGNLPKALKGAEHVPFKILMSHNPRHWRAEVLPHSDIQLTLAGHTHAMQLRAGHHSPSSYIYPEWGGAYYEGQRALYVNIGIGVTLLPVRIGARPEITVFTLEKGKE